MPEEQIRCRAASPVAVLTVGLMRMALTTASSAPAAVGAMDRELQYHARKVSQQKHREGG